MLLDTTRTQDYIYLAVLCGIPSLLAMYLGIGDTIDTPEGTFVGWFDKYNFWPFVFVQPLALWLLRACFKRVAHITPEQVPERPPPLIQLFKHAPSKQEVYELMRASLSSPKILGGTLIVSFFIQVADLRELVSIYALNAPPRLSELDWSIMYMTGVVSKPANAVFCVFAYITQFTITTLGLWGMAFLIAHNLFFLDRIYQRSKVEKSELKYYITLDLDDVNRCFGFRAANDSFNTQVVALTIAGVIILMSRFANVEEVTSLATLQELIRHGTITEFDFFPDIGQVLLGLGWLIALFIVTIPALVKLTPRLPYFGGLSELSIDTYLREFLTDDQWQYGSKPTEQQINFVAAKFARNGFWPTGDNRASQLFFYSFSVFLLILYPIRTDDSLVLIPSLLVLGIVAYALRTILLKVLHNSLAYVDERLTTPNPELLAEVEEDRVRIPGKVFVSYRREDSLAYTRLLTQTLTQFIDEDRLFMDLSTIQDGDDFVATIEDAIRESDSVIVVIGTRWLTCVDDEGTRRLDVPGDFVRLEVATALAENKNVVPVLVGDADMPKASDLPEDMEPLWRRHARELSDSRWEYDVTELARALANRQSDG